MAATSAGLLLYRFRDGALEVLLVHPGGPWWAGKQAGAWSIPKGETGPNEDLFDAARREFTEETGLPPPPGPHVPLKPVRLRSGKTVHAWGAQGDCDPSMLRSNSFEMEWPPRSGRTRKFPEIDEARFCAVEEARRLINPSQRALIEELLQALGKSADGAG